RVAGTYAKSTGLTNTTKASAIKAYADELLPQARNLRGAVRRHPSTGRAVPQKVSFVLPIAD
ncbi:MAG TPA: hypothetical protein VL176_13550, partial [Steroidobacteraceae bacterium]|nr:hypothetical protein [Steroidobacteraceae bacterium]